LIDKSEFPFFVKNPNLIYLDSACTSIKPQKVIDAEISYYQEFGACAGRSAHKYGRKTSEKMEESRENIAKFVNADTDGTIFTKNTTEGLNIVIKGIDYSKKRKVVTTDLEHHALILPLLRLRDEGKIELKIVKSKDGLISEEAWKEAIDSNTKLVATHLSSNTTGIFQNITVISKIAHEKGAQILIDGAQGVPHKKCDMKKEGIDFLCFSSHKMMGPTGVGALCMKKELLKDVKELVCGGGTVKTVTFEKVEMLQNHERFEAGISDFAGIIGFSQACNYINQKNFSKIEEHEEKLRSALLEELQKANARVLGNLKSKRSALYTFNINGAKAHDLALMLDKEEVAVRSGYFCAQPALDALGSKEGGVRVSAYAYNSLEEIRKFGEKLGKIASIYS
jgi:cysteine desulfurase/selenocysteine lyase